MTHLQPVPCPPLPTPRSEASAILAAATPSSLVILDELGRGTSTVGWEGGLGWRLLLSCPPAARPAQTPAPVNHTSPTLYVHASKPQFARLPPARLQGAGAAIAEATLAHLVQRQGPLTLFITHYPEVCLRLQQALPRQVGCYRMAHAEAEGEEDDEGAGSGGTAAAAAAQADDGPGGPGAQAAAARRALGHVVFLFRLVEGVAPASYGLNVARMAQLPGSVIERAAGIAARVQAAADTRKQAQEQQQAGSGPPAEELAALEQACRQFLQLSLAPGGRVDVEAGRQLQRRVRQLLAA